MCYPRLRGQTVQSARVRGSADRFYLQQEQGWQRAAGAGVTGSLERRDGQMEHHLRRSAGEHVQPRENGE